MSKRLSLVLVVLGCAVATAHAQVVGDTVRLESSNPAGVPVHPAAGIASFVRWDNGTVGKVTAIDAATGWREVRSEGDVGWVVRRYLVVIDPEPDPPEPPSNELPAYGVGTWNLEHFRHGASRGFPENTNGGPSYGARTAGDLDRISEVIKTRLLARILILNEVNGRAGERASDELDELLGVMGNGWRYEITLSGDSQRVAILYDSKVARRDGCQEIAVPPTDVQGSDIFDRDPLACQFTLLSEAGEPMNDLLVVGVHLKSGQALVQNHNAAMATLAQRIQQLRGTGPFPAAEADVLIGGDLNASRYDNKLEDFWDDLDAAGLSYRTLAPQDGELYPPTRLAGVPLAPRSQIDYLMASGSAGGLASHLVQSVAHVHEDLLLPAGFDDFREHVSDHLPVTVRVRVVADDDP
jgi:endonuclease/exonuclease/phosphatase family metal-dependent hydrolase